MMIWVDYMLLSLMAICALCGLWRGIRAEIYALFMWTIGITIGLVFCGEFEIFLKHVTDHPILKITYAFISLLCITLLLGSLIGFLLGDFLSCTHFFGRVIGVGVGITKGCLIITVLVMIAGLTPLPTEPWWQESQFILPFQKLVLHFRTSIPPELARYINYK